MCLLYALPENWNLLSFLFCTQSTSKCLHIMPYNVSYTFSVYLVMVTILLVLGEIQYFGIAWAANIKSSPFEWEKWAHYICLVLWKEFGHLLTYTLLCISKLTVGIWTLKMRIDTQKINLPPIIHLQIRLRHLTVHNIF